MNSIEPYFQDEFITLYCGDVRDVLPHLAAESVQCCVTSPPYFGLRDYGTAEWEPSAVGSGSWQSAVSFEECDHLMNLLSSDKSTLHDKPEIKKMETGMPFKSECRKCGATRVDRQIGLEATPQEFVAKMAEVFTEVRRVLRKDGTLWLNLGDSYAGSNKGIMADGSIVGGKKQLTNVGTMTGTLPKFRQGKGENSKVGNSQLIGNRDGVGFADGFKPKDLLGMPWRVAFALQAAGWWLRQDIIWSKPNPMPESVTDRCTKAHEYMFLMARSAKYFYDAEAVKEPITDSSIARLSQDVAAQSGSDRVPGKTNGNMKAVGRITAEQSSAFFGDPPTNLYRCGDSLGGGRNKRSVWTVTTQPFKSAHFATFPPKLIEPCILAGTSEKGCCAACGSPWVRVVDHSGNPKGILGRAGEPNSRTRSGGFDDVTMSTNNGKRLLEPGHTATQYSKTIFVGWRSSCKCKTNETVPATVLDPFAGAGTTLIVAKQHGRRSIGIELNPEYCEMIVRRIKAETAMPLFD